MKNRKRISKPTSKRIFRKTAGKTHPLNLASTLIQRGGIHLAIALALTLGVSGCKFAMSGFTTAIESIEGEVSK